MITRENCKTNLVFLAEFFRKGLPQQLATKIIISDMLCGGSKGKEVLGDREWKVRAGVNNKVFIFWVIFPCFKSFGKNLNLCEKLIIIVETDQPHPLFVKNFTYFLQLL